MPIFGSQKAADLAADRHSMSFVYFVNIDTELGNSQQSDYLRSWKSLSIIPEVGRCGARTST